MSELWYPGRPPFCSKDVISFLDQYVEELIGLIAHEDGTHLCALESIADAALTLIDEENNECLGTDEILHSLYALFADSTRGAILFYKAKAWDKVQELAINLSMARDQLIKALEEATEDGRSVPPESAGGTRTGSDSATDSEQASTAEPPEEHQHQSEGPLQEDISAPQAQLTVKGANHAREEQQAAEDHNTTAKGHASKAKEERQQDARRL